MRILTCLESRVGVEHSVDVNIGALVYFPLLKPLNGELTAIDVLSAKGPVVAVATELLRP